MLVESNDSYHSRPGSPETIVGQQAHVSTPRLQQFLVEKSPDADRLVAALKKGPVKPNRVRVGEVLIDLDRILR